jgi:hypothetical protein
VTDDLEVFLAQVENDPDLVGSAGDELAEQLDQVLDARGSKQRREADHLRDSLAEWADDDRIEQPIAEALDDLLRAISRRGEDD